MWTFHFQIMLNQEYPHIISSERTTHILCRPIPKVEYLSHGKFFVVRCSFFGKFCRKITRDHFQTVSVFPLSVESCRSFSPGKITKNMQLLWKLLRSSIMANRSGSSLVCVPILMAQYILSQYCHYFCCW